MSAVTSDEAILASPILEGEDSPQEPRATSPFKSPEPPRRSVEVPQTPIQVKTLRDSDDLDPALRSPNTLTQLRNSLVTSQTEITRLQTKVGELEDELADSQSKLSDAENKVRFLTAAKDAVELDLKGERSKRMAADEDVEMLRGKLDDARKAIGTMRKDDNRNSMMSGLGYPEGLQTPDMNADSGNGRKSVRTSTLFGASQRKISESGSVGDLSSPVPGIPSSTSKGGLRELRLGFGSSTITESPSSPSFNYPSYQHDSSEGTPRRSLFPPSSPRRSPATEKPNELDLTDPVEHLSESVPPTLPLRTGRRPRPTVAERLSSLTSPSESGSNEIQSPGSHRFIGLDEDDNIVQTLKSEVAALRAQLENAQEARVASEDCLKALRDFIATSNADGTGADGDATAVKGIKLPPLPTDRDTEEAESALSPQPKIERRESKKSGWGLGGYFSTLSTPATKEKEKDQVSHANSVATSVRSEAGDLPSADSSVKNLPLEPSPALLSPRLEAAEHKALPGTPLSAYVSSWTRGISVQSPGIGSPSVPDSAAAPGQAKRSFSFFGSKKTDSVASVKKEAEQAAKTADAENKGLLDTQENEDGQDITWSAEGSPQDGGTPVPAKKEGAGDKTSEKEVEKPLAA